VAKKGVVQTAEEKANAGIAIKDEQNDSVQKNLKVLGSKIVNHQSKREKEGKQVSPNVERLVVNCKDR
jgi:hypothetical protein